MEPTILRLDGFTVVGVATSIRRGSENPEQFAAIWDEFERRQAEVAPCSTDRRYYGVSFCGGGQDTIDYVAGMAVKDIGAVPVGLVRREVPGAAYAVFACSTGNIGNTYGYIFGKWLAGSGYKLDESASSFEKYPPAGNDQEPVLIHVPVVSTEGNQPETV